MKKLTCILLILFTGLGVYAQQNNKLVALAASIDSLNSKNPIEKIHIQLDKPYYALGDTLWMKIYVVNENNGLSDMSQVVYADLSDDKGAIKTSLKLPLTQGMSWAAIPLSDSLLQEGIYHLRAYTTLMRNFDAAYFFDRTIRIGSRLHPESALTLVSNRDGAVLSVLSGQALVDSLSVKFFPEGGNMVNGLLSKVAFKAVGSDGLSREVSGSIVDKDNNTVAEFSSEHAGMGSFMLQPVAGNSYTAIIKLPGGGLQRFVLPAALPEGYILSVNQNKDNIFVSISASDSMPGGEVSLVAQTGNIVRYTAKSALAHGGTTTIIPKKRFPEGIVQFTLFSPQFQPVAERLVFIRNNSAHLNVKVVSDKPEYKTRDKVRLNLQVTGQDGKPVTGSFSMAVTDESVLPNPEADEVTIFSNLLLTADLKGYVEHPNYYFTEVNEVKEQQLDNLLLTQGWRRFVWKNVLSNTFPPLAYKPEGGMGLSGKILTTKGQPSPGAHIYLLFNTKGGKVVDTVADEQGRFSFERLGFDKSLSYNMSATDAKGKKDVKVVFDQPAVVVPPVINLLPDELPVEEGLPTYAANTTGAAQGGNATASNNSGNVSNTPPGEKKPIALKEVEINERKEDLIKKMAFQGSSNKAGYADFKFTFVDLAKTNDMGVFLAIQTAGIKIIHGDRQNALVWKAETPGFPGFPSKPYQVIVDGKIIGDPLEYSNILPQDIAGMEIVKDSQVNNTTGKDSGGSIIITLKKKGVNYDKYIDEHELDQAKAKAVTLAQKQAEQEKTINLKEVTIREKAENEIKKIALQDSKNPAGGAAFDDAVFTFVDLAKAEDVGMFLAGHATGLRVTTKPPNWIANFEEGRMEVIVNGQQESASQYSTITPDQIAAIEIIKGSQTGNVGKGIFSGSINITLKSGNVDYQKYIDEADEKEQKNIMLKEVNVKEKKLDASIKAMAVQYSQNLAGPGNADQVLTFIDLLGCQSDLSQCLQGRLTNIVFKGSPLMPYSRGFDDPMLIVVDGIQGRSLDDIMSMNVASVEVLRGGGATTLYGMHGANGVLIITTKHGGVDYTKYEMEHYVPGYKKPEPVLVTYKFQEGYDIPREFYSPDYDNPALNKEMEDQRTTIYWKPNIVTDKNGKASVSFFNADAKGTYRIITEGLDGQDKLGRGVDRYTVK